MNERVTFFLGGQERELRLNLRAIIAAEKRMGNGYSSISSLFGDMSMWNISVLTWAALLHADKNLPLDDVIDWMPYANEDNSKKIHDLINALFRSHLIEKGFSGDELEKKMEVLNRVQGKRSDNQPESIGNE